jgi:hypothetical protein
MLYSGSAHYEADFLDFACSLTFRDLPDVKRTQSFCNVIFWELEDGEKKKSTRREIGPTTRAKKLAAWLGPPGALSVHSMQS